MPRTPKDPTRFLPLRPDVFVILLALLKGDAHGYAIIKASASRGDGRSPLQPGALYRLLRDLLREGLVAEVDAPADADRRDERRRYYRLTPFGREVVRAEARRMSALLSLVRRDLVSEG
jgi:DNA-binding PadR family transcriptional regulator